MINHYDLLFFGIIICSSILALFRGGIAEILSLTSWILTFWLMTKFSYIFAPYLPESISNTFVKDIVIFIIIFILVAIVITIIKKLATRFISAIGLGGFNYLLGLIFGIIRGFLICVLIVIIFEVFGFTNVNNGWKQAKLAPLLNVSVNWIIQVLPQKLGKISNTNFIPNKTTLETVESEYTREIKSKLH